MPIQNKTVTLLGASTKLVSFTIFPQADGSYRVSVAGTADDGSGFTEQLAAAKSYPAGTAVLDNISAVALSELRKQNGLET